MSLKVKIKADASQFDRTMSKTKKSVRGFGKSLMGMKSMLAGVAVSMGAAFATRKIVDFIKSSSSAASSIEDLTLQFETLTKSASVTKDLIADMKSDAAKSPLSIEDYAKAGKTLLAFGVEAKDIMPSLRQLGDISMGNAERFKSLSLAFAQTQAAGRLMGQEVLQFVNAGFNPLQQISKKTGESMLVLKKRMEDGAISSSEVAEAFKAATSEGGLFFKAIERGATTTSGKIAKVKDALLTVRIGFGTGFNEGLKTALDAMNEGIPKINALATEMGQQIGASISEAVNGDTDRLIKIGEVIGVAIKEGIKIALMASANEIGQSVFSLLEKAPGLAGLAMKGSGLSASGHIAENKGFVNQTMIGNGIRNVRDAANAVSSMALPSSAAAAPSGPSFLDTFNSQSGGAGAQRSGFGNAFDEQAVDILKDIREAVKPSYAP